MNDFREEIRIPTEEEKKELLIAVLRHIVYMSDGLPSSEEILEKFDKIEKGLSPDEFNAIYGLAMQIRISIEGSNINNQLFKFLNLYKPYEINSDNLLKFVKTSVKDIEETRIISQGSKWNIQIPKIFKRMSGENPYEKELNALKNRSKIHIVTKDD